MTLVEVIALTFAYYHRGDSLPDQVLKMYLEDLADLDPGECAKAYESYRRNPSNKNFPLPAHIRDIVSPGEFVSPETEARETAQRIVGAVSKYGWNNARDAKEFIGPVGWGAVQRQGGWSIICEQMNDSNKATFQAQMRDVLEGVFKHGLPAIEAKLKIAPRNLPGELVQANFAKLLGEKPDGETI